MPRNDINPQAKIDKTEKTVETALFLLAIAKLNIGSIAIDEAAPPIIKNKSKVPSLSAAPAKRKIKNVTAAKTIDKTVKVEYFLFTLALTSGCAEAVA